MCNFCLLLCAFGIWLHLPTLLSASITLLAFEHFTFALDVVVYFITGKFPIGLCLALNVRFACAQPLIARSDVACFQVLPPISLGRPPFTWISSPLPTISGALCLCSPRLLCSSSTDCTAASCVALKG
jgi:hypothetical protein